LARLYTAVRRIAGARLNLGDSTGLVLRDLEARAWWLKTQRPDLALLVVDYLQLINARRHRRPNRGHAPPGSRGGVEI
jgi:replicative DNA helicase